MDISNLTTEQQAQLFEFLQQFFRTNAAAGNVANGANGAGKRFTEQDTVVPPMGQPVIRNYGAVAAGLINQVKQRFKVIDDRVQLLIESICDSNPITKLAPIEEKLFMAAVGECALLGTEKHVNARWIKAMKMENMTKAFAPICPKKSCCNVTEMVSTALLCPGGGIARPYCTETCQWKYDCEHKNIIETPSIAALIAQQTAVPSGSSAAWSDDQFSDSEEEFSAATDQFSDSEEEFSAATDQFSDSEEEFSDAVGEDYQLDSSFSSQEELDEYIAALAEGDQLALDSYFSEQIEAAAVTQENSGYYPENKNSESSPVVSTILGLIVGLVVVGIVVLIVYLVRMRSTKHVEERN